MDDDEFDYLRERSPEQEAATEETEPDPAAGMPGHETAADGGPRQAPDQERGRTPQAGV